MTTLSGTVTSTVEGGGLVLVSEGTTYLLMGEQVAGLRPGDLVMLTGERVDAVTIFAQGLPFEVASVQRLGA